MSRLVEWLLLPVLLLTELLTIVGLVLTMGLSTKPISLLAWLYDFEITQRVRLRGHELLSKLRGRG